MYRVYLVILFFVAESNSQCILRFKDDVLKKSLLFRLQSLYPNKYITSSLDTQYKRDDFIKYEFKLCSCPSENSKHPNASLIQYQFINNQWVVSNVVGEHSEMDIDGGNNWYALTYYNGDKYNEICTNMGRKGKVMIICDSTVNKATFNFLYEYKHASKATKDNTSLGEGPHCGYIFELRLWDSDICGGQNPNNKIRGKSNGSILCILFFTFFGGYLIIGLLYKRFVQGAFGIEQIPNLATWRNFLELQADGCDYFFRQNPIVKGGNRRNDYSSIAGSGVGPLHAAPGSISHSTTDQFAPATDLGSGRYHNVSDENLLR